MQVSIETIGTLGRKLTVRMPADELESTIKSRLDELTRTVRLKGFRPGRVPVRVIEQRYGAQVRSEATGELIQRSFTRAIEQEQLRPAVQPSIETSGAPQDGEFSYTATFDVLPEIGKIDIAALEIERPVAEVAEADVDEMIETLRQQRRTWQDVERAAQEGDLVMFESVATVDTGRVPAEGKDRSGTVLGSGGILLALEEQLVGLAAGDEREVQVEFPADYRNAALAGKKADLQVHIVRVSEPQLPEVDAEFFAAFGLAEGGLEQFRAEVRANLERELKGALTIRLKNEVVNKLLAAYADLELPEGMIEAEARSLAAQAAAQVDRDAGAPVPEAETFKPEARRRVASSILLGELGRQADLRLDAGRLQEMIRLIASTYEDPEEVIELYRRDARLMEDLQGRVMEEQVVDWIADHAATKSISMGFKDVMQPIPA